MLCTMVVRVLLMLVVRMLPCCTDINSVEERRESSTPISKLACTG